MNGKYEAAFIIPVGTLKKLGESGWEFGTSSKLSIEVENFLIDKLSLRLLESYLGVDSYIGENIKMSVIHSEGKEVENIYFQLRNDAVDKLSDIFQGSFLTEITELFIPK